MVDNYYVYDSTKGIITTDTTTIQGTVEDELKSAFGDDIDLSPETPQGRFAEILTIERAGVVGYNAAHATQLNIDYATGLYLDAIGSRFRTSRIGASRSRVFATVTGTAGTVIPAGSLAKSGKNEFYAENDITLPIIGAYFLSVETGAIECEAGTLTKIVSSVIGWTDIDNSAEPSPYGAEQESDALYRARIKESRYSGISFVENIGATIKAVDNVLSSFVYDNGSGVQIVYDTVDVDAHSVIVIVDGGADADIAEAIYSKKDAGCAYTKIDGEAVLTFSDVGNDGEIVTVSGVDYRLKTTMEQAYDVQIGASANATATSLSHAIMGTGTSGTDYFAGTVANLYATSSVTGVGEVTITGGVFGVVLCSTDSTEAAVVINDVPQSVTQYVTDGQYGVSYPVIYNRPVDLAIEMEITVSAGDASEEETTAAIIAAVEDWAAGEIEGVDGLVIGANVSPFEIGAAVSFAVPYIYIKKVEIAELGGSLSTAELIVRINQIARIDSSDISVVYV